MKEIFNSNSLNIFISSFLKELWNSPETIAQILENSEPNIVQTNLAPFICHNFYCNYLSGKYLKNNLLYVITIMLKKEIDNLENINQVDNFLENTKCGFLLEELQKVPEIQIYFKNVIIKMVEIIERSYSFREINLNISEILKEFNDLKEEEKNNIHHVKNLDEFYTKIVNRKLVDLSINYSKEENNLKMINRNTNFVEKYSPDITYNEIENRTEKAKKENKEYLLEYFNQLGKEIKTKDDLYSNTTLMKTIYETNSPSFIFSFYKNNFLEAISFLEILIEDLMKNFLLIPNSIKYICKIISILIRNKFKDISKVEENAFISKFFIEKLLIPIISFPNFNALISDFVISGNTIKNIKTLNSILIKMFSGKLFLNNSTEGNYTPFNWFFIDNMEKILNFFDKTTNVKLPDFIDKYINDQLPSDYTYEFFNENENQICSYISICFNINNLFYLINGLKKEDNIVNTKNNTLKKTFSRLKDEKAMNEINNINDNKKKEYKETPKENEKNKDKEKQNEVEIYYLYNHLEIDKKYENLFIINNRLSNFYIDIKKEEKNKKLSENDKNIIKVKNYLCNSLGNYRILNKSDFNIGSTSSTIQMLNDIKICMTSPTFILNNNTIPSIWYINSLLEYLNKIPEDYKENDFQKLFEELKEDLNKSIKSLDFQILILFRNKLKFIDKIYNYYENKKKTFNNILINENVKYVAEKVFIPVKMTFKYGFEEKIFELKKSHIKEKLLEDKIIYEYPKKNQIVFKTIEAFTRYFPNLAKYQRMQDINPIDIINELSINKYIEQYFEIIKEKILKMGVGIKDYEIRYQEKIKNYIMNKLYAKMFPPEPDDLDNKIYKYTMNLSSNEPKLIIGKDYIFDIMLPDILNEFNQINIVKNPFKQLECIHNIFKYIESLVKFNEGEDKEIGADDIGPVLNYVLIIAHPIRIHSYIKFIKIFLENNGSKDINLVNFESMLKDMINTTPK